MIVEITGTGSQTNIGPGEMGYSWKVLAIAASLTGTSTADSSIEITVVINGTSIALMGLSTSSTVLTTNGALLGISGSSNNPQGYLASPLILSGSTSISISVTNNGSVSWAIMVEEFS